MRVPPEIGRVGKARYASTWNTNGTQISVTMFDVPQTKLCTRVSDSCENMAPRWKTSVELKKELLGAFRDVEKIALCRIISMDKNRLPTEGRGKINPIESVIMIILRGGRGGGELAIKPP